MNYYDIFQSFLSKENIPFYDLSRSVIFPEKDAEDIYSTMYISHDTPWTVVSYDIYGTIDYWWILCLLNKDSYFYAKDGDTIYYIKEEYVKDILKNIQNEI